MSLLLADSCKILLLTLPGPSSSGEGLECFLLMSPWWIGRMEGACRESSFVCSTEGHGLWQRLQLHVAMYIRTVQLHAAMCIRTVQLHVAMCIRTVQLHVAMYIRTVQLHVAMCIRTVHTMEGVYKRPPCNNHVCISATVNK